MEPATHLRPLTALPEADRTPGIVLHLSPLADLLLPTLGGVLGPLVAWLAYRDRSPALDAQGKAVLNFRLSVWLYGVIVGVLTFLLFSVGMIGGAVGAAAGSEELGALAFLGSLAPFVLVLLPVMVVLGLVPFIFMIVGVIRASSGQPYTYPLTIRFLR
ncbi:hypothetical protein HNQ07_002297 [Deinococcus metalli]|uniref:DUF4870 domain-containing protein n=1 Tax=Deinococcus metalli TaxID=1141878 RepID=A0A7W8NRF7_9DEIO|nr:DUF4870 domain-containing protein [Deinococcus metalli]MBB5376833.1 hypothetical protein [Deinococcus metalli]GHF45698.1 hypothetical protein GCM10017781_22620 [Deinococcus metalli]